MERGIIMSTMNRPELSETNPYYISKHRFYELKHFCLQYKEWRKELSNLDPKISSVGKIEKPIQTDPVGELAIQRLYYEDRIRLIHSCAFEADPELAPYIVQAVTEECSYTFLRSVKNIPCSKDYYYDKYRKFFWLLAKER